MVRLFIILLITSLSVSCYTRIGHYKDHYSDESYEYVEWENLMFIYQDEKFYLRAWIDGHPDVHGDGFFARLVHPIDPEKTRFAQTIWKRPKVAALSGPEHFVSKSNAVSINWTSGVSTSHGSSVTSPAVTYMVTIELTDLEIENLSNKSIAGFKIGAYELDYGVYSTGSLYFKEDIREFVKRKRAYRIIKD